MPSSHHRHGLDNTRLGGLNRIGDKSRLSVTENCATVLPSLEMRCEQSFVLSRPSFQFTTRTCLQTCSHRRQDWTELFSLQYTENSLDLSPIGLLSSWRKLDDLCSAALRTCPRNVSEYLMMAYSNLSYTKFFPLPLNLLAPENHHLGLRPTGHKYHLPISPKDLLSHDDYFVFHDHIVSLYLASVMLSEDKFSRPRPRPRTHLQGQGRGRKQKFGLEANLSSRT